jgi:hypothetical protein
MKLIGGFFILILIFGGLATFLHLFPTLSLTQESGANAISQATAQYQIPTPTPSSQQQPSTSTPSSSQQQSPVPTSSVVPPVIPAERPLYSAAHPDAACNTQGGYWTGTSDNSVTCNSDGSKVANTLEQPTVANLGQLEGGDQSPWLSQNFIAQVQATINQHSHHAFGINFQPEARRSFLNGYLLQNYPKGLLI